MRVVRKQNRDVRKPVAAPWGAIAGICLLVQSAWGLQPQTLFNFQVSPGTATGALVEGPDGNFYGTTAHGGPHGGGTVFRVTSAGILTTLVASVDNPAAGLAVGNDGLLYGMNGAGGGPSGFGSVFKMSTNGELMTIAVFDGVNAGNPQSGLVLAPDGNFYGMSQEGGTNEVGNVFRVTPAGVVTSLVSFDGSTLGGFPAAGLTVGPDGELYGVTEIGGTAGAGTIFKMTTAGAFTPLYSFQSTNGFVGRARLTVGPDHALYGIRRDGGSADLGMVYRITTNGTFSTVFSFSGTNGTSPEGELALGADGQLYGTTQQGGAGTLGTVFKVSTNGGLTTLVSFNSAANSAPQAGLLRARDGNFYGCSPGAVFKMTPGGVMSILSSLIPLNGLHPQSGLIVGPDGSFYGTTRDGGSNNMGTIFKLSAGGALSTVFDFDGTNGSAPEGALVIGRDGNFYGTTSLGGAGSAGTIFRFATNGALTTLMSMGGTNGGDPQCQLVVGADGVMYGTAPEFGAGGVGTVFRITTNGVFTVLLAFNGTNGANPEDGLTAGLDGNLYGTTADGTIAATQNGTVFKITPGGALTTLVAFSNTNGASPLGGLVQGGDGVLYGTTSFGGTNFGYGTIFKLTTNGAFTQLFNFHFTDGEEPVAKMIFGPDGALYGTTAVGGHLGGNPFGGGEGTVFRITTNGVFTSVAFFDGTNGFNLPSPLAVAGDGSLLGVTGEGGPGGGGTIFRVVVAPMLTGVARSSNGSVNISGTGLPGTGFRLLAAGTPAAKPFPTLVTSGAFDTNGDFSFTDAGAVTNGMRFYRLAIP